VDDDRLRRALTAFEGSKTARRLVTRQAADLLASGRLETDLGIEPTIETVVRNMTDAPDGHGLIERWNWWVGALEFAYGGYLQFRVRVGGD
jgi:hypothetical protein